MTYRERLSANAEDFDTIVYDLLNDFENLIASANNALNTVHEWPSPCNTQRDTTSTAVVVMKARRAIALRNAVAICEEKMRESSN